MANARPLVEHQCEWCSEPILLPRAKRFCSYRCNKAWQSRKHWGAGYREPPRHGTCQECGGTFTQRRHDHRLCLDCRDAKRQRQRARLADQEAATQRAEEQRNANRRARKWRTTVQRMERSALGSVGKARWVTGDCAVCSEWFLRRHLQGSTPRVCGKRRCVRVLNAGAKRLRNEHLRRAVFHRDDWTCGLCGQPVDPAAPWPSDGYPTIDHIKPRSLGGNDDLANLQCAHHRCNTLKGVSYAA